MCNYLLYVCTERAYNALVTYNHRVRGTGPERSQVILGATPITPSPAMTPIHRRPYFFNSFEFW